MKKVSKRIITFVFCLFLIASSFPNVALATGDNEIDLYYDEVWVSPPAGSFVSFTSNDVPAQYGDDNYHNAACISIALSGIEDDACFNVTMRTRDHSIDADDEEYYRVLSLEGFTKSDIQHVDIDELTETIIEDVENHYSATDEVYTFPVQLEGGEGQLVVFYYRYNLYDLTGDSKTPVALVLDFQTEKTSGNAEIDLYYDEVWVSPPAGSFVSFTSNDVPAQYGDDNYHNAACISIALSGIEDDACFNVTMRTRDHSIDADDEEYYRVLSLEGFTKSDIQHVDIDELTETIIEDVENHYSATDEVYTFPVQLEGGEGQLVVFYYRYNLYDLTGDSKTPVALVLDFQTGSSSSVLPELTGISPAAGQIENKDILLGVVPGALTEIYGKNATCLIVPKDVSTVEATLTLSACDLTVTLNGVEQGPISATDNTLTVTLQAAPKLYTNSLSDASKNEIKVSKGNKENVYTIWAVNQRFNDLPNRVVDYLCIGSQYTNNQSGGGDYGTRPIRSLVGSNYTMGGIASGPVSLGNFGGYIVYEFDKAIKDNPNNPYGIDFITYGNSVEGSNEFGEVGQVWVSEDGNTWYALAGGMHYEDYADWDYSVTYTKQADGSTAWADNRGKNGTNGDAYPLPEYYPWHPFIIDEDRSITLTGIYFPEEAGVNEYGNTLPPFAGFGYTDMGQLGTVLDSDDTSGWGMDWHLGPTESEVAYEAMARNIAGNPYLPTQTDSSGRIYSNVTDGMDLAWAVNSKGQPVVFENGVHYVKIVTATNIYNKALGEKSTEVNMVRVAQANDAPVGKTDAPAKITVDGAEVALVAGQNVYNNVPVCGGFAVSVDAPEGANIYINNNCAASAEYDAMPTHKIVRVIVQEGEKEPWIAVFNLTELDGEPSAAANAEALIAAIGTVTANSKDAIAAARAAYDLLTDAQKALVGNYATLTAAEAAYADLTTAADVDALIDAIGEVTLQSSASITAARDAYDALTEAQQALVKKYATLTAAEETYATLAAAAQQAELDAAAAQGVSDKISAIGTVTLQSEDAINAARSAYDALTDAQKALVTNLDTLTAAEATLSGLKADKTAAEAVEAKIAAIGTVTLGSENAITAARAAYDALNDTQKALVTNLETLTAAEAALFELKNPSATITLDANGGTVNGKATDTITFRAENAGQDLPTPVNSDSSKTFGGWYAGQIRYTAIPDRIADLALVAQWIDATTTPADTSIYVTFRLIGSTLAEEPIDLADGDYHGAEYVTWIPTTGYTVDKNATVADLFIEATNAAGIQSVGADRGYVSTVYAPDVLGGYALSQFTNGQKSGWMYTKNGAHTNAINTETMENGDVIIFHYVDDYAWEVEDWSTLGGSGWPQQSDSTNNYWNKWLTAADTAPGGSSGSNGSGDTSGGSTSNGDKKDETKPGETPAETTTAESTVTADDGSTVKTETEKVVDTTTNEDGSVTETVTETTKTTVTTPDNVTTVTETVVETETTTDTVKNDDGSVTDKTEAVEKVTETVTGEDGKKTTTVTETAVSSEVTTDSVKNADGSVTNTVSTTDTVKETVTAADGSKAVSETTESKSIETTVGADGKTIGTGTVSATTTVKDESGKTLSTAVTEGTVAVSTDDKGTISEVTTATTKTTDAVTGEVTEETTVTTEAEMANGTTGKTVENEKGETLSAEANVSEAALQAAQNGDGVIELPITVNTESGATVQLNFPDLPDGTQIWAEIGTTETSSGDVAYLKLADGVVKLLPNTKTGSVIVPVNGSCEVIVKDNSKSFTDVDTSAWYGDSVKFVTAREIFNGNGDGTFAPGATMNRAMAAQIIFNFDGATAAGSSTFSDVDADAWYAKAVAWAAAQGIVNGYNGAYSPLGDITRQDLVKILYFYAQYAGYDVEGVGSDIDLLTYADGADVSDYAAAPMRWAIASGLIQGYADNTLRPRNTATRAEVAAIMQRMVMNVVK